MENLGGETSISHSVHILIGQINSWLWSLGFLYFSEKTDALGCAYCNWIQHLHTYNYSNPPIWNELLQRESSTGSTPRLYHNTNTYFFVLYRTVPSLEKAEINKWINTHQVVFCFIQYWTQQAKKLQSIWVKMAWERKEAHHSSDSIYSLWQRHVYLF